MLKNGFSVVACLVVCAFAILPSAAVAQVDLTPDEEEEAPPEQIDPGARDGTIQSQLESIFSQVEELQDVEVAVETGVVKLNGETTSPEAVTKAEELAQRIDGVLYVDNSIEISHEVGERVSPAIARAREKLQDLAGALPLFGVALLILALFWGIARLVARIGLSSDRISEQPFIRNIARQIVATVVFLIGVVFVLDLFEVTTLVSAVLGTAGVIGLVLGFAFRDIAENYLASVLLGLQQPFERNDLVDINEFHGKVIRLTTRATVLMTLDGNHVHIPNSTVYKSTVSNYSRNPRRRFTVNVAVSPDEDLVDVQQLGLDMFREADVILDDPEPNSSVEELGDSTVVVAFYGWIDQREYDWARVKSEALRRLKRVLDAAGIEMPEPTYRVLTAELAEEREEEEDRMARAARELEQPGMDIEAEPGLDDQIEEDRQQSDEPDLLS